MYLLASERRREDVFVNVDNKFHSVLALLNNTRRYQRERERAWSYVIIINALYRRRPDLIPAHQGVVCGMLLRQSASDGQRKVVGIAY